MIMGDFNMTPTEMEGTAWLRALLSVCVSHTLSLRAPSNCSWRAHDGNDMSH